jgi:hypothetical protein
LNSSVYVGFAFKTATLSKSPLITLGEAEIGIDATGAVVCVYHGGGGIDWETSDPGVVLPDTWMYFEVNMGPSTLGRRAYVVKIDGVVVLEFSFWESFLNPTYAWLGYVSGNFGYSDGGPLTFYSTDILYDDFYMNSRGFQGDTKIYCKMPVSDGAFTDWTPESGSDHYAMVDEVIGDDDLTSLYALHSATIKDSFLMDPLASVDSGYVLSDIQLTAMVRKDAWDSVVSNIRLACIIGGIEYSTPNQAAKDSYSPLWKLWATNPKTGKTWTLAAVNAVEFYVKRMDNTPTY